MDGDQELINDKGYTVGIDATNLRGGGGLTHLVELLRALQPTQSKIDRIVVWGGISSLNAMENKPWLVKINPTTLNKNLLFRTFWQRYCLSKAARSEGCSVLFVPGGSFAGDFQPVVTMSQNLLPFEMVELKRYGFTMFTLKLLLLRLTQSYSFRKADGVIFLTKYARRVVLNVSGKLRGKTKIIPHGLNSRFNTRPKQQKNIIEYDFSNPYRILYVSIIDQYKHQWNVVEAVADLRHKGFPIALDLVGPAYQPALKRLNATIDAVDINRDWVNYHGAVPFDQLHHHYVKADLGVFASSCENMPNILLETMASGLPIASSKMGPMPEMLGSAGLYFNPEQPNDIARALRELINSPELRTQLAQASYSRAQEYSWQRCANETFEFLTAVSQQQKGTISV